MAANIQHSSNTNEHYTPAYIVEPCRRLLGGAIDLDPASCAMAQEVVQARDYYGLDHPDETRRQGLKRQWQASTVFLNPPGGLIPEEHTDLAYIVGTRSNACLWWNALATSWTMGDIDSGVFVGFTLEIMRSTLDLPVRIIDLPMCLPKSRIPFDTINTVRTKGKKKGGLIDPTKPLGARVKGTQPAHANVIVWLPDIAVKERSFNMWLDDKQLKFAFAEVMQGIGPILWPG